MNICITQAFAVDGNERTVFHNQVEGWHKAK